MIYCRFRSSIFQREKSKRSFKIEKHRPVDWEDIQTEEFNSSVAVWLLFDETEERISSDSEEARAEDVEMYFGIGNSCIARFENAYIDIPIFWKEERL